MSRVFLLRCGSSITRNSWPVSAAKRRPYHDRTFGTHPLSGARPLGPAKGPADFLLFGPRPVRGEGKLALDVATFLPSPLAGEGGAPRGGSRAPGAPGEGRFRLARGSKC